MKIDKKISSERKKHPPRTSVGETVISGLLVLFLGSFAFAADIIQQPGQKIFIAKCAQCHGKDAKGLPNMAKVLKIEPVNMDLTRAEAVALTDEEVAKTVAAGKNKMPKFKGKLTDKQVQLVVKYLRSLQTAKGDKK